MSGAGHNQHQAKGNMNKTVTIELKRDKECRGSVRFATADDKAPVTNVYVSRALEGVNDAQTVKVTIEVIK